MLSSASATSSSSSHRSAEDPNPVPGMPSLDLRLARVNKDPNRLCYQLKDRLGKPEGGGSKEEQIKILLEGDGTQVGQDHTTIGVLLILGTNNPLHQLEKTAELATRAPLNYTGQTVEQHRSDR
jgi:hypothetical protein